MGSDTRRTVLEAAITASLALGASAWAAEPAAASSPVDFRIASQPLAQALNAWAQQCGLQLIWPASTDTAQLQSRSLEGRFEPLDALQLLLQDSGLEYSVLSDKTVIIEHGKLGAAKGPPESG